MNDIRNTAPKRQNLHDKFCFHLFSTFIQRFAFGAGSSVSHHFLDQFLILSFFHNFCEFRHVELILDPVFTCLGYPISI